LIVHPPLEARPRRIGSLLASGTFLITLSFLVTTPAFGTDQSVRRVHHEGHHLLGAALYSSTEALAQASALARVQR